MEKSLYSKKIERLVGEQNIDYIASDNQLCMKYLAHERYPNPKNWSIFSTDPAIQAIRVSELSRLKKDLSGNFGFVRKGDYIPENCVDLTDNFNQALVTKLPEEIDIMEDLGNKASLVMSGIPTIISEIYNQQGYVKESDLELEIKQEIEKNNGTSEWGAIVESGPHTKYPSSKPIEDGRDRIIENGDCINVEFAFSPGVYSVEIARTFNYGNSEIHKPILETLRKSQKAVLDKIKPGVNVRELYETAKNTVREHRYVLYPMIIGHSMGMIYKDAPDLLIRQGESWKIEKNMILAIEVALGSKCISYRISDTIAVEDKGVKMLTTSPRDLESLNIYL